MNNGGKEDEIGSDFDKVPCFFARGLAMRPRAFPTYRTVRCVVCGMLYALLAWEVSDSVGKAITVFAIVTILAFGSFAGPTLFRGASLIIFIQLFILTIGDPRSELRKAAAELWSCFRPDPPSAGRP